MTPPAPSTAELLAELRRHPRDYLGSLCGQAADEIERLRSPAGNGMREALSDAVRELKWCVGAVPGLHVHGGAVASAIANAERILDGRPSETTASPSDIAELVRDLRARRVMRDDGNGNVYDIADDVCEKAADFIEAHLSTSPSAEATVPLQECVTAGQNHGNEHG